MSEIVIRPTSDFSANGAARGTLVAYDEGDEPLWEHRGNWSDRRFVKAAAADLAEAIGISAERSSALLRAALQAARRAADAQASAPTSGRRSDKPDIIITGRELDDLSDECIEALRLDNHQGPVRFVLQGGLLSQIVWPEDERRPFVRLLTQSALGGHLARLRRWVRHDKHGEESVCKPDERVLQDILALETLPFPSFGGFVNTPVLTADGRVLSTPGYDDDTGLFLNLDPRLGTLGPTPGGTGAALALLDELLGDFPFATQADRCHTIALLLTGIVRPAIDGPAPLFMVESSSPASGKGLLAEAVAHVLTGRSPVTTAEPHGEEEWRKRITSIYLSGAPLALIDNVVRHLNAAAFNAALTAREWSDRPLGTNRIVTCAARTIFVATANNPEFGIETARRVCRIRIVPQEESPWERTGFRHDPLGAWVRANRGPLLSALLTLVHAWVEAGRPPGRVRMGSFQEWADIVGGILAHAGVAGFLDNRSELMERQVGELAEQRALVEAWADAYGSQRVEAAKLFDLAKEHDLYLELRSGRSDHEAKTRMGRLLARLTDRVIGGYRITRDGSHSGVAAYKIFLPGGSGAAQPHPTPPTQPIQVGLVGQGGVVPYLGAGGNVFSHTSEHDDNRTQNSDDSSPVDRIPPCGERHVAFHAYADDGRLICKLCSDYNILS